MKEKKRVAIVGSGCSGLAALWALRNTNHDVHLYEADDRLGGHTNTVPFRHGENVTNVDTGFIVINSATYPNFLAFLKDVGIKPVPTDMTFGVSRDQGLFEWAGTSLSSIFTQRSNLLKPRMWRMIYDIIRFNQFALDLLTEADESEEDPSSAQDQNGFRDSLAQNFGKQLSIGDYLDENQYSDVFRNDYLIPMTASVWSTSPDKVSLEFPAITLVRFMWNHHLLSTIAARPTWMTIKGGSKQYIDIILSGFPEHRIHLSSKIDSLEIHADKTISLQLVNKTTTSPFDHIILATHGDTAMSIIHSTATPLETQIMSSFQTSTNTAVLHSDLSLMPTRTLAWSAWNYITTSPSPSRAPNVCLTYWMNLLQHVPYSLYGPVLVTLNPLRPPAPALTQGSWTYNHPLYNTAAIHAQKMLPQIQNVRGISYAGAWTKYGFHEDGFSSGLKVAMDHLGAELPFEFMDSTFSRGRKPTLGWKDHCVRIFVRLLQISMVIATCAFEIISKWTTGSHKEKGQ